MRKIYVFMLILVLCFISLANAQWKAVISKKITIDSTNISIQFNVFKDNKRIGMHSYSASANALDTDVINYCKSIVRKYMLADSISTLWQNHVNEIVSDTQLNFKARIRNISQSGQNISIGFNVLNSSNIKVGRVQYIKIYDFTKTFDDVKLMILQQVQKRQKFIERFNSINSLVGMEIYP